jgi:hypothetical protein
MGRIRSEAVADMDPEEKAETPLLAGARAMQAVNDVANAAADKHPENATKEEEDAVIGQRGGSMFGGSKSGG